MSGENITILEGGKAENFGQVTKLKTSNGSGNDLWVPKTDVKTGHLSVKKNGLYYTNQYEPTASEKKDGKFYDIYGWDTITVSVKKKTKGKKKKKSPKTGLEYDAPTTVEVDDNGNLIETELPAYIEIEQPPDKLEYHDGENISKSGMVVKAYYADDREWGVVPNNETALDPSTASGGGGGGYESDLDVSPLIKPIPVGASFDYLGYWVGIDYFDRVRAEKVVAWMANETPIGQYGAFVVWLVASASPDATFYRSRKDGNNPAQTGTYPMTNSFTHDGKTVYYAAGGDTLQKDVRELNGTFALGVGNPNLDNLAWTIAHGESTGGSQTITVGWTPPEDEEELTDTFDITVNPT